MHRDSRSAWSVSYNLPVGNPGQACVVSSNPARGSPIFKGESFISRRCAIIPLYNRLIFAMPSVIELYEKLSTAPDDKTRARIIAEAFEKLEERYPNLSDVATNQNLRETELRLLKEIEQVRADLTVEVERVRSDFKVEIEQMRGELKETELRLLREIESVRLEIKSVEVRLTQAIHRQTLWVIGSIGAIIALIRLLEWFLTHLPK